MTVFILKIPSNDAQWQEDPDLPNYLPQPRPSFRMKQWNDGADQEAYNYASEEVDPLPFWPAGTSIIGAWDAANGLQLGQTFVGDVVFGAPTYPFTSDYYIIRPLGNAAGKATGPLDSARWQGHAEQKYLDNDNRYLPTDSPFTLQIERQDFGSNAQPWDNATVYATGDFATSGGMWQSLQDGNVGNTPFGGSPFWEFINQSGPWGWKVTMISSDPLRDITARAIGQYTDAACTLFEFTTGAFIQDGGMGPFFTECPPGNRAANNDQVNFALLLGAAQEGFFNLRAGSDDTEAEFWSHDQ